MVAAHCEPVICMRMHICLVAEAVQYAQTNAIYKNNLAHPNMDV